MLVACAGEEEDPLPAEVRALINKAKEADTPGNEAAAIALFENSAKQASPTQPNPLTARLAFPFVMVVQVCAAC